MPLSLLEVVTAMERPYQPLALSILTNSCFRLVDESHGHGGSCWHDRDYYRKKHGNDDPSVTSFWEHSKSLSPKGMDI